MFAEHSFGFSEYPYSRLSTAEQRVEHAIQDAGSLQEYALFISDTYSQSFAEKAELTRMDRMARFYANALIAHSPQPDIQLATDAFYMGELIAHGVVYELNERHSLPSNLADAYWKRETEKSRPRHAKGSGVPLVETTLDHSARMHLLAQHMLNELINEIDEDPAHMATAQRILSDLGATEVNELMAQAGYHLIMREILMSNHLTENTQLVLDKIRPSIPRLHASDYSILSLKEFSRIFEDTETPIEQELPTHIIPLIREKAGKELADFAHILEGFKKGEYDAPAVTAALRYVEYILKIFNEEHALVKKGELLMVSGEYFGATEDHRRTSKHPPEFKLDDIYTNQDSIHGLFGGFYMAHVPSKKELRRGLKYLNNLDYDTPKLVIADFQYCPVIRINNPSHVMHMRYNDACEIEFAPFIDIPLHYKSLTIRQLPEIPKLDS